MSTDEFFQNRMPDILRQWSKLFPENVTFGFIIDGTGGGAWQLQKSGENVDVSSLDDRPKDCEMRCDISVFGDIISGQLSPIRAFSNGQLLLQGDVGLALRLQDLLQV